MFLTAFEHEFEFLCAAGEAAGRVYSTARDILYVYLGDKIAC